MCMLSYKLTIRVATQTTPKTWAQYLRVVQSSPIMDKSITVVALSGRKIDEQVPDESCHNATTNAAVDDLRFISWLIHPSKTNFNIVIRRYFSVTYYYTLTLILTIPSPLRNHRSST
jgi:hypothetical protein